MELRLKVCTCGKNKVAEQHTEDIHDEKTGECRSFVHGIQCPCVYFVDSGQRVKVQYDA
jgi:hypothetical protein